MAGLRHVHLMPKIGGMPLGSQLAAGSLPLAHISYPEFRPNDSQLARYWPSVPTHYLADPAAPLPCSPGCRTSTS
jgi:hypothetical protein